MARNQQKKVGRTAQSQYLGQREFRKQVNEALARRGESCDIRQSTNKSAKWQKRNQR